MAAVPGAEVTLEDGEIVIYKGGVGLVCVQHGKSLSLAVYHLTMPTADSLAAAIPLSTEDDETFKYVALELSKVIAQAPEPVMTDINSVIHRRNAEKFAVPDNFDNITEHRFLPVVVIHPDYFGVVGTIVGLEEDNEVKVTIMTTANQVDHLDPSRFKKEGDCRYFQVEGKWVMPYNLQ